MCIFEPYCVYFTGAQQSRTFDSGNGPIFLSQLDCLGDETSLLDCPTLSPPGLHTCDHSEDAGVRCIGMYYMMHMLSLVLTVLRSHSFFHCSCHFLSCQLILFPPDINQCLENNGNCSQLCHNHVPDYTCGCRDGYELNPDGFTCSGKLRTL